MDYKKVHTVLLRVLILNWLVAILKLTVGVLSGSIAIIADGVHSFFDGASNIVGLVGIHYARRPKDATHPYGYTKYEAFAAGGILFFTGLGGYEIGREIFGRIFNPVSPVISFLYLGIVGAALCIDIAVARYEYRWGKRLRSRLLTADARHTASHLFTTLSVIIGSVAVMFGYSIWDIVIASAVLVMVMKLVFAIFKDIKGVLIDSVVLDPAKVQALVRKVSGVRSAHDIRSRGDRFSTFVDIHIALDPLLSLKEAHDVSHRVQEEIKKGFPDVVDVVVHFEPEKKT